MGFSKKAKESIWKVKIYSKYLISKNPPISNTVNRIANKLKYLSINSLIPSPNFQIKKVTTKNLADRLTMEANKNIGKFILNAPPVMVKTLYGRGVNPAVKTIQKFH